MTVYIDDARNSFGRMIMSHMLADTIAELHAMADRIGMRRAWFQPLSSPHYDVSREKRAAAVRCGAIVVDRRGIVAVIKRQRVVWIEEMVQACRPIAAVPVEGGE